MASFASTPGLCPPESTRPPRPSYGRRALIPPRDSGCNEPCSPGSSLTTPESLSRRGQERPDPRQSPCSPVPVSCWFDLLAAFVSPAKLGRQDWDPSLPLAQLACMALRASVQQRCYCEFPWGGLTWYPEWPLLVSDAPMGTPPRVGGLPSIRLRTQPCGFSIAVAQALRPGHRRRSPRAVGRYFSTSTTSCSSWPAPRIRTTRYVRPARLGVLPLSGPPGM